jgi:hypothetical protein
VLHVSKKQSLLLERAHSPSRVVHHGEALEWLRSNPARAGMSVVTSLPDVSETSHRSFAEWQAWFVRMLEVVLAWLPREGMAVFYQSDIRHEGVWIDKGYLVSRAAEACSAHIVWHKIVCRKPAGTLGLGRPTYAHMICVSRTSTFALRDPGPDVIPDAGAMSFSRGTGAIAALIACKFIAANTETHTVVDPFCGEGTILAAANHVGLDAIGVELNRKRAGKARLSTFDFTPES